jgi:hypothetical protein
MGKTRLNQHHRDILRSFADQVVKCPAEQKARDKAYAKATDGIRRSCEKQFPAADMAVLAKYGVTTSDLNLEGGSPEGKFIRFSFDRDDEAPPRPGHRYNISRISFDAKASQAIEDYDLAAAALKKARDAKLADYKALITAAVTFEDVLDVWPAAAALAEKIRQQQTALVVLSADKIAAIRADNAGADLANAA